MSVKKTQAPLLAALCAGVILPAVRAQFLSSDERRHGTLNDRPSQTFGESVDVRGAYVSANRQTGELAATGGVRAASGVFRFHSRELHRDARGLIDFGRDPAMTTCTNDERHLHWHLSGKAPADWLPSGTFAFQDAAYTDAEGNPVHRALTLHDMWLYWENLPVMWIPWWYYPLDTDYGFRLLPGYRSRWGLYALSGYVYDIYHEHDPNVKFGLGGSSYLDWRAKNGLAVGQTVRWRLGDLGKGKVWVKYAWDEDYDRYERHWHDRHHYNYANWGSTVDRERYHLRFEHEADFTERDSFRLQGDYYSDSHYRRDFTLRDEHGDTVPMNEAWYEHRENDYAGGASVSGPLNDFYAGTARLPEAWFAVSPQPVLDWPVNYESQTRAGYLNRNFAEYRKADDIFRYYPYIGTGGRGADYQAFRADSNHRITLPLKFADLLSFVPRAGYRATWWSDSGDADFNYTKASGDGIYRGIAEVGATLSARGSAWLNDQWRHTVEPYLDYSFQQADLSGDGKNRYYAFDNYDRSVDWLDQFDFEGRGLPYCWHGVRPGIRNVFQRTDDKGILRTVFDTDVYAAVPFTDESCYKTGNLRGYAKDDAYGNYTRSGDVVPGIRARFHPNARTTFGTRIEFDTEDAKCSYADVFLRQRVLDNLSWYAGYIGRDHRIWDYLPSDEERWNCELANIFTIGFEHQLCDRFAWSPYIRHDCRRDELEEVGCWFDYLTDCLGYRLAFDYETSYTRYDGSKYEDDVRVTFFIYLRALGPGSMLDLARF